ncbi:MAG: hypothetical protein JW803_08100 [Endomicrobiales bacterium]|nr:hypothetical protein [Endomicrobiales bacterium]
MTKLNVAILTEGGSAIGWGHIMRCLSLYQACVTKGHRARMFVHADKSVSPIVPKGTLRFNWLSDSKRTRSALKGTDIAIVDSYLTKRSDCGYISHLVPMTAFIDDNVRMAYPGDFVINGTVYSERYPYVRSKNQRYMLGARYMPLRKEYWRTKTAVIKKEVKRILVSFGGNQHGTMIDKVLSQVVRVFPKARKTIIAGVGARDLKKILRHRDKNTKIVQNFNAREMHREICRTDIMISAGGQTLYELARVGVPTIAIAVADNQFNNVKGWSKAGSIKYAGYKTDKTLYRKLAKTLNDMKNYSLRAKMNRAGRSMVDGKGAQRIIEELARAYEKKN